jgi:hypothetical protein
MQVDIRITPHGPFCNVLVFDLRHHGDNLLVQREQVPGGVSAYLARIGVPDAQILGAIDQLGAGNAVSIRGITVRPEQIQDF